jgi:hypothetical protein
MASKIGIGGLLLTLYVLGATNACFDPPPIILQEVVPDTLINPIEYLLFGASTISCTDSDSFSSFEYNQLKEGDLILRRGFGNISDFIADFLDEKYPLTHAGILIQTAQKEKNVWHATASNEHQGIVAQSLKNFCRDSHLGSLVVVRLKSTPLETKAILLRARQLKQRHLPFDFAFDHHSDSASYCIEFIRNCYLDVLNKDYFPNKKSASGIEVLGMNNFFNTQHFDCIINHFDSL